MTRFNVFLLGFSFLVSKVLGLLRDNLLASGFGASAATGIFNLDTYYAAFRLPDLLFNLLSYGVLSAAFVPLFVEVVKREGKPSAFKFANEILHFVGIIILVLSGVLFIFAPQFVRLLAPGFAVQDLKVTADITRIMLLTPFFFTIGSIAGGVQNAFNKFRGMALAPILYNLGIIGGIIFLSKQYGVYGVAIGVSAGAFLNMLVLIPGIYRAGFSYFMPKIWWTARVKEMIALSLPRIFGMSVSQLALVVDTIIASTLPLGSITIINFAINLGSLPMGIIGTSVAIVSFGTLAAKAAEGKFSEFTGELRASIRQILFLLIPLVCGMWMLKLEAVRLFLARGKFTMSDALITANTLGILLGGLAFGGVIFILARAFYALKNTKIPVAISIVAVALNIVFSLIFTKLFSLATLGLALANAISNIVNATLLVIMLQKKLRSGILDGAEILKSIAGGVAMSIAVWASKSAFLEIFKDVESYAKLAAQTAVSVIIGALVYFLICRLLHCKELHFWRRTAASKADVI